MRNWIIAAFLLAALAGCASTPEDATPTDDKAATEKHTETAMADQVHCIRCIPNPP